MKPIDPRLLRYARATRAFLVAVVALGAVGAGLVIAQAMLIAEVVVGAFQHRMPVTELGTPLLLLAAVAAGRALVGWLTELAAHRASAAVKSELRGRLLERATRAGPGVAERAADRFAGRPGHPGCRRAGRLLLALPAAVGPRGGRAGGGTGADRHRGLGLRGHHRGHPAAHPGLHGADRLGHPVPDGPSVAAAVPAVRSLPRRRRGAADAEGLRPGQGAGRVDPADHR